MIWKTSKRDLSIQRPLVMAIVNVTPDSFSDGSQLRTVDDVLIRVEQVLAEGAGIIDIGGESTRPGSERVPAPEELQRVVRVVEAVAKRFDVPISVDTSKSEVARRAVDAGAEIINDISAMRFDERIGDVAAATGAGLVLMHSRGEFEAMHRQPPVDQITDEVTHHLQQAVDTALLKGVSPDSIVVDLGIGFGKTQDQNLELLAKLDKLAAALHPYPMLIGTSRKSFIGRVLGDQPVTERLNGSLATAAIAIWKGVSVLRVHDVKETVEVVRMVEAIKGQL